MWRGQMTSPLLFNKQIIICRDVIESMIPCRGGSPCPPEHIMCTYGQARRPASTFTIILVKYIMLHSEFIPINSDLQDYAQKTITTFVNDSFKGFLKFHSCICRHMIKLIAKTFVDKFVE